MVPAGWDSERPIRKIKLFPDVDDLDTELSFDLLFQHTATYPEELPNLKVSRPCSLSSLCSLCRAWMLFLMGAWFEGDGWDLEEVPNPKVGSPRRPHVCLDASIVAVSIVLLDASIVLVSGCFRRGCFHRVAGCFHGDQNSPARTGR